MRGNAGSGPRESQFSQGSQDPGLAEALVVWGLVAVVGLSVLLTYSLVDADGLYNVSHDGLAGGASRLLVFLNFPVALMAIAVLALVTDRLGTRWPSLVALALCLVILVPGVVDQDDLDAQWINILPALGVAIVLALTIVAVRAAGVGGAGSPDGDRARIAVAAVLAFLALPWIFAELGLYIGDVPGLASIFELFRHDQFHLWDNEMVAHDPGKGHEIPLEEAYAKLKNLARAAKLLRERHAKS